MWGLIPLPYRILGAAVLLASWSAFMVYGGWHECAVREQARQKAQALAYAEAIKAEQIRGDQIALSLDAEKTRQKVIYRTITKEVPRHVSPLADSHCTVPAGFIRLHNAAAEARSPDPSVDSADAPSGIALSAVADAVADNYATCNETRAQLNALIDWETKR